MRFVTSPLHRTTSLRVAHRHARASSSSAFLSRFGWTLERSLVLFEKRQAAVVDGDLPRSSLKRGVEAVLARHPMLRACIRTPDGPKEPLINILGEEREDGDPLYFCESECESLGELAERVLSPEEPEISGEDNFTREWQGRLERNLDNARLPVSEGPNWRMETIRLSGQGGKKGGRTAQIGRAHV